MGFYLPSEVSRLVLSYLLDHDLQDTSAQFLEECPFLQELRQVAVEDLADYTRVNGRSLMEILREYKQLIKTISFEYKQVNPNNNFEAPQRMLDLILEQRRAPVQGQKSNKKVVQPIRPKPPPAVTPSIQISPNVRKPLRSSQASGTKVSPGAPTTTFAGVPEVTTTPIHNITINLPPVEPAAKSPIKKAQATSAAAVESPTKNLVINTENTLEDVPDHENEDPVSSKSKPRSSTNSHGKTGSRKGKKPIRRGTHEKSNEQTDDEFLAELLGKPIAEMLDESVMKTKGQDQQKAISDVAAIMLTPSLLDKLVDVVDLDQLPRPKDSAFSSDSSEIGAETESRLSTPELCKSTEENTEETSKNVTTPGNLSATILSSLPQTPIPLSELEGNSSLSCVPPVFVMSPPSNTGTSSSTAVSSSSMTTSQSITSSTPSSLVFLQSSRDNTITLTPGTVQYDQFAAALEKIPSVDDLTQVSTKKEDPLAQLISATIINSPTKAPEASAELDLTNVPIEIVGGQPQPAQSSLKSGAKSRKRKISTPKHLGAGKKSKSGNEVTEDKATTTASANAADKQILDKFQIQLQAVIGGAAKPVASKKTTNIIQATSGSVLEKVATLSKTKGPLGKENVTAILPKESDGPRMLVLTPITREEIQRKELAKRKSQLASKKEKSPRPMPPSPHIRNLIFSPPKIETPTIVPLNLEGPGVKSTLKTPEKNIEAACGVKILSPLPSASPLRRTDSSWNREIKIMFREQTPRKEDAAAVLNDPNVPLPTSPLPLSEISITPTMTSQPPVEALTKSLVSSNVSAVTPFVSPSVSEMTPSVTSNASQATPPIRQSSPGMIPKLQATPSRVSAKTTESTPQVIPRKIMIPILMPAAPEPTTPTSAKELTSKVISSKKVSDKKRLVTSAKKDRSPLLKPSWDERMRSSLGTAETNMDHIAKRYSESSPGRRRRSPRKKRKPKSSPSNVFSDDDDESPPEIQLEDGQNISPESQKILDFIGTSLLESLEKNEADSSDSDDDDDEDDKIALDTRGLTDMPILANSPNKTLHKQATKTLNRAIASIVATTKKPLKNANKNKESVDKPEKNLEPAENVTEICLAEPSVKDGGKSDSDIMMHTIKPETTIELLTHPVVSPNPDDAKFKTPQKADVFAFKTPRKSPLILRFEDSPRKISTRKLSPDKTPHIPVSPLHLLSPAQGKRAVPLTPSRSIKKRQDSTLDTPVLQSPGSSPGPAYNLAPTTPRGNKTPSAPYYTPSPSTRDSFPSPAAKPGDAATPGLRFLLEEGQKLSSCEDSMSPAKAKVAGKSCRKSFRNMFKKSSAEGELGSLLEKQISKYPFDQEDNNYATFKSPDAGGQRSDYTSSPHIVLRPSSTQASPSQAASADGSLEKSFVSPNRTCYLSPTAMAMSSSFLGIDYNAPPETAFPSSESSTARPRGVLKEPAPQPTVVVEEATEAQSSILELVHSDKSTPKAVGGPSFQLTDFADLSDTEQSADCSKVKKVDPPSEGNDEIDFPDLNLSEDSNSGDDEGEGTSNISEINRKGNTFIEAFQEVKKKEKDSALKVTKIDVKKPPVKWSPRKPRRLTMTALKSSERLQTFSLTNDSSPFEAQFDIHNLDKLQTSVQNYSEDTSSSMDSQFESPRKTTPKKKSASPKKVPPSPKLTVKITSKKMDEKRKSAEKLRKRIVKEAKKEDDRKQASHENTGEGNKAKQAQEKSDGNERIVKDSVKKADSRESNVDKADENVTVKGDKTVENSEVVEKEMLGKKKRDNVRIEKAQLEKNEKVSEKDPQKVSENIGKVNTRKTNKRTDAKKTDEELKVNRGNEKKSEVLNDNKTDFTSNKSVEVNKEMSTKNRRGRGLDTGDDNLSVRPRRGISSDNQVQEAAKKTSKNTEQKSMVEKLELTESSATKPKQTFPKSHKTGGIKNPPSKYAEENLVKLNQELTLQFSPRKSSPVSKEPPAMDPPSAEPDIRMALGLVRTSKRKAEDSPTLPEKKTKLIRGTEEVERNVKNVRVNKHGREITPIRLPSQGVTPGASSSTVTKGLSPSFGVGSPPRTRKALASYSPKKARKDELPQEQSKSSRIARKDELPQEQSKGSRPGKKEDLLPATRKEELIQEQSKSSRLGKKEDLLLASQGDHPIKGMTQEQSKGSHLGKKEDLLPAMRKEELTQEQSKSSQLGKKEDLLLASRGDLPIKEMPQDLNKGSRLGKREDLLPASHCQEQIKGSRPGKKEDLLPASQGDLPIKGMTQEKSKGSRLGKNEDLLPASREQSKSSHLGKEEDLLPASRGEGSRLRKKEDLLPTKQCDLPSKGMPRERTVGLAPKRAANIAAKKPDLITKHTANILKDEKNVSLENPAETSSSPSRIDSSVASAGTSLPASRVNALAQTALEIMNRINLVGKKEGLMEGELNKPAEASNVKVDHLPGDSEKEAVEQENESPQCTLQDDSYSELQMSEMFIFQTNLPFGVFEEDLEG